MSKNTDDFTEEANDPAVKEKLDLLEWAAQFCFEAYGTNIGIRSNNIDTIRELKSMLPDILPNGWNEIEEQAAEFIFSIMTHQRRPKKNTIYKNVELIRRGFYLEHLAQIMGSQIRLTVGEFAKNYVFLHSGVVGWQGRAIIFPGTSFSGKSSLTAEFVRRGALYYSDDFTILDNNGFVHPFARKLSLRGIINDYSQKDVDIKELGGSIGTRPIPVEMIVLTKYEKNARPQLEQVSRGEAMMTSLENSLSVRQKPAQVISVLGKILENARIYRSNRGEAAEFVELCLDRFENGEKGLKPS